MSPAMPRHHLKFLFCLGILTIIMTAIAFKLSRDLAIWNQVYTLSQRWATAQLSGTTEYGDDSLWDTQPSEIPLFNRSFNPQGLTVHDQPTDSFRDNLRSDLKYVTSWGMAGFSNDFQNYMSLLFVAFLSGRVAILPPVTGSWYINCSEPQLYLSKVFDLERLSRETNIPLIEWHHVKKYDSPVIDNLGGWSNEIEYPSDSWDNIVFGLNISMSYTQTPNFASLPFAGDGKLSTQGVVAFSFPPGYKEAMSYKPRTVPSRMNGHTNPPDQHLLTIYRLFYAGFIYSRDLWDSGYASGWTHVGQHAHFTAPIEQAAKSVLRKVFGLSSSENIPPFIAVHIRHGDFALWCDSDVEQRRDCYASVPAFGRFVSDVKHELATRLVNPVQVKHVYVASNEPRRWVGDLDTLNHEQYYDETKGFWDEVASLGWGSYDWEGEGVIEKYGKRYPGIIDAAILSMGTGFVGTRLSTYSLLAKLRVETWNGGISRIVPWGNKHSADDADGIWRSESGI